LAGATNALGPPDSTKVRPDAQVLVGHMLQRKKYGKGDEYDACSARGILLESLAQNFTETQTGKREDDGRNSDGSDERQALEAPLGEQPLARQSEGDHPAGDRRAPSAAIGLEHIAIHVDRPLPERFEVDRDAQRSGKSLSGVEGIAMQDASIQESMGPIQDRTREHLGQSDKAIIQYRRLLRQEIELSMSPLGVRRLSELNDDLVTRL